MDMENKFLSMTRFVLRHAALPKEEKDEIETIIAELLVENKMLQAEKEKYYNMLRKERKENQLEKEVLLNELRGLLGERMSQEKQEEMQEEMEVRAVRRGEVDEMTKKICTLLAEKAKALQVAENK